MAEKATNEKMMEEQIGAESKVKENLSGVPTEDSKLGSDDMFFDPFADKSEEKEVLSVQVEDNVYSIPTFVYRKPREVNGKIYYTYFIGISSKINGVEAKHTVNLKLDQEFAAAYEMLNMVFGSENKMPLSILRTEITDSNTGRKTITYKPQISVLDDEGVSYVIKFKPQGSNDKQEFEYVVRKLQAKGLLK